ncbi:MAG: cation diffusion facilitator family transporter, partial [Gammaproteobacteria bacterium]|nr:cation diffusion facilitator family transporter [Gammaproteobacteria bacterium]
TILADGVHSLTDLVSDIAVLASLKWGDLPPDNTHPYGHRRVHTLVAVFVGMGLLGAAGIIGFRAIASLQDDSQNPIVGFIPLSLAIITIPAKEILFHITRRVGLQTANPAVLANAWHHRTDAFTSLAATVGIAGAMFAGAKWQMLDGLTATVLAAFLLVAAIKMIIRACDELTDKAPEDEQIARLENIVYETPGVRSSHAVRARRLGSKMEMDLHVRVDPTLTVKEGHDIASDAKRRILQADDSVQQVVIHIEPDRRGPDRRKD